MGRDRGGAKKSDSLRETIAQVTREYQDRLENLVYNAFNRINNGLSKPEDVKIALRTEHKRIIRELGPEAYIEGLREGGIDIEEMDAEDKQTIADWVVDQQGYCNGFAGDVVAAAGDREAEKAILARVDLWVQSMATLGGLGLASAQKNKMVTWKLGATEEHCTTCHTLNGKRHRVKWFTNQGYIPQEPGSPTLECKGFRCLCGLFADNGDRIL